ncbi:MAG: glycogen synthase [Anaerolineales bacterium]|nr:glycogen synthase [Anaerolineales bacterium]
MAAPLKILFLSAEVVPFAKSGGLGDVGGALPKFLRALGHDVRVVLPAYRAIETDFYAGRGGYTARTEGLLVPVRGQGRPAGVLEGRLPGTDVPVYFIAERNLFDRPELYGYDDDVYRFAFYSRAALVLAEALDWRPDLIHAHDWHSAPAITWLATAGQASGFWRGVASLFTIHNLAHQGRAGWDLFSYLGLTTHGLAEEGYGAVNLMARGIYHATLVSTVSPTYAREIMTPAGGAGLDGLLRHRAYDVHGILNGLDYGVWNPATDRRLAARFDAARLEERAGNKRALQERAGLPARPSVPLVAMVSRLDWQKGLDLLGHVVHLLLNGGAGEAQFVVLGSGAAEYEGMLAQLAGYHRDRMAAFLTYDADLAQLIYGGSDLFLMPSRFEPCGLGQLIAMRYGSAPVVRATGGLVDTVQDGVSGFSFADYTTGAFWDALQRAIYVYNVDRPRWQGIQRTGMTADYSWGRAAQSYQQVYAWALARMRGG